VFNEALLTPYIEPPTERREQRPPPKIISGEPEWEVEEILKHRRIGRGYQYLIRWKNFPVGERTWEPTRHLTHAKKLLEKYNKEHGINVRALPILPGGYWDFLVKRYTTKEESKPYEKRRLFIPEENWFIDIDEDVDPRGGVMSRSSA
jgi:hypothetical protein